MKPCECGSREFKIDALYVATDHIVLADDDSEDFSVIDTDYGDGEWEDHSNVRCVECGKTMEYCDWSNHKEQEVSQ